MPESPSLHGLRLYCLDLTRSKKFYETLGFEFTMDYKGWTGPEYCDGKLGEDGQITIRPLPDKEHPTSMDAIQFKVSNVPEILRRLSEMNETINRPMGPMAVRFKWAGTRFAEVRDPDGRRIQLYESQTPDETDRQADETMENIRKNTQNP